MTKQFTTPCFIRKNTPELRAKLEEIGYIKMLVWTRETDTCLKTSPMLEVVGTNDYAPQYYTFSSLQSKPDGIIDCGTNEALFLDLAAMRNDTDKGQLFTINGKGLRRCNYDNVFDDETFSARWRKATATEIIEWHKKKGEKE